MSRQQMPEQDNDLENGWTEEAQEEYAAFLAEQDLPPHKRAGYAETMYEAADLARKAKRENS